MSSPPVIILGCGFTGSRVAKRFLARGFEVFAAARDPDRSAIFRLGAVVRQWNLDARESLPAFPANALVLHSVPDISPAQSSVLHQYLSQLNPARVVYLSTTGVFGSHPVVDATTEVDALNEKSQRRIEEERFVSSGAWSSMVLRPAAIYGPHRGVQVHLRGGKEPRSRSGMVSRIHVDDLAAHAEAAMLSGVTGAYPVADERPCSSEEIADFCRRLLRLESPADSMDVRPFQTPGRRVDGSQVREVLGLCLRYPDYEAGILASIIEEAAG